MLQSLPNLEFLVICCGGKELDEEVVREAVRKRGIKVEFEPEVEWTETWGSKSWEFGDYLKEKKLEKENRELEEARRLARGGGAA